MQIFLKTARYIGCHYLTDCINSTIYDCMFPEELKVAELSRIYQNDDPNFKEHFKPISVLPTVFKRYGSVLKDQISP